MGGGEGHPRSSIKWGGGDSEKETGTPDAPKADSRTGRLRRRDCRRRPAISPRPGGMPPERRSGKGEPRREEGTPWRGAAECENGLEDTPTLAGHGFWIRVWFEVSRPSGMGGRNGGHTPNVVLL